MPSTLLTKPPLNRWPPHWHAGPSSIKCTADPTCPFTTTRPGWHAQWNDLQDHCCAPPTATASHALLLKILWQSTCLIRGCTHPPFTGDPASRSRNLFAHEQEAHGSARLSDVPSFVKMVREEDGGRFEREAQDYAFDRLVEKMEELSEDVRGRLFEKAGYERSAKPAVAVLKGILSAGSERARGGVPYSVPHELFLWAARPDGDEPGEEGWEEVWRKLREDYKEGVI